MNPNNKEFSFSDFDENFIKENKKELQKKKEEIWKHLQNRKKKSFNLIPSWTAIRYAAILIIGIGMGYWIHFFTKKQNHIPSSDIVLQKNVETFLPKQNDSMDNIQSTALSSPDTSKSLTPSSTSFSTKKNTNTTIHSIPENHIQHIHTPNNVPSNSELTMEKDISMKEEPLYTTTSETPQPKVIHIHDVYTSPSSKQDNALSKLDNIHKHSTSEYHVQAVHLLFKKF